MRQTSETCYTCTHRYMENGKLTCDMGENPGDYDSGKCGNYNLDEVSAWL